MDKLTTYPRPNVAVDIAVLTVIPSSDPRLRPGRLAVLVQERPATPRGRALPGRFLREGETIRDCVQTAMSEKVGLDVASITPRLLRVFDTPGRDPRGWTISLAHYVVLPPSRIADTAGKVIAIDADGNLEDGSAMLFDHNAIVREAATSIRESYELGPDPDGLLEGPFTLADLKHVHEAVLGERLQRDTFRRRMEARLRAHIDSTGNPANRVDGGRPARLWIGANSTELTDGAKRRLLLPRG